MDAEHELEDLLLHDRFVRGLAHRLVRDAATAEDVAQDAWLAALRSGERLASFPRWAAAAVRNLARNARRSEARRGAREAAAARPEGVSSAEELLAREALRSDLVAAVLALDAPLRDTLVMRYFDGLPPREIARRRGEPVETVRTHLKRGLARLRARLQREHGGAWAALLLPLAHGPRPPLVRRLVDSTSSTLIPAAAMSTQAKLAAAVVGAALIALLAVELRRGAGAGTDDGARAVSAVGLADPGRVETGELVPAAAHAEPERSAVPSIPPAVEAATADLGGVLVRVAWHDGTPAEGIGVRVQERWTSGSVSARDRIAVTDALGEARIAGLAPGAAFVQLDRGFLEVSDVVAIESGEESELALVLGRGYDLAGVVLDPLGAPVADAAIVFTHWVLDEGDVVARTDHAGRFHVRALGDHGHVWATARGFAPTLGKQVGAGEGVTVEVELVLLGPGGALAGTVVDPDGVPVEGAWVLAGLDHELGVVERVPEGGTQAQRGVLPGATIARTDAEGRYAIEGLAPGRRRVAVRAPGLGAHRAEVEVVADVTRLHDVRLAPGVTVTGRVAKADGTPATRASVEVGDWTVLRTEADPDADGRYRLEGLEAGEIVVRVTSHRDGDARVVLHGTPGETLTCDVTLVPKGSLRGRLVDARGEPLAGWMVWVEDDGPVDGEPDYTGDDTDAEGRFDVGDLHDRPHRLLVRHPEHRTFPVIEAAGVRPGAEDLELVVEDAMLPSAFVRGRVVTEDGAPLATARIALGRAPERRLVFEVDAAGEFEIGPIPPGAWRLKVWRQGLGAAAVELDPLELAVGAVWEVGDLVVPETR